MIRVNINESFPITVALLDEETGQASSGQTVYYDIRQQPGDISLTPALAGTLPESTVESGIYTTMTSISGAGSYIIYATCSGFMPNTEEIIVNAENIYDLVEQSKDEILTNDDANTATIIANDNSNTDDLLVAIKQNRHYNISVEDVLRTTDTPTASQAARNVPKGRTDYVITRIKLDSDVNWSGPSVVEGLVYAWYRTIEDRAPYKMGDNGL